MTKIEMKDISQFTDKELENFVKQIEEEKAKRKANNIKVFNNLINDINRLINKLIGYGFGDCLAIDYVDGDDQWTWAEVADWLVREYRKKEG